MSIEERRAAAHVKMEELVNELTEILDAMEPDDEHAMPTAWVLVVGYDSMTTGGDDSGHTAIYPRNGAQSGWKTRGILGSAMAYLDRDG